MTSLEADDLATRSSNFKYSKDADTNALLKYIYEWVGYYARNGKYHMSIEIPYGCDREAIVEDVLEKGFTLNPVNNSKYISLGWGG